MDSIERKQGMETKGKPMKRWLAVIMTIAIILLALFLRRMSGTEVKKERYSTQYLDVFDTVSTIIGYDVSEEAFKEKAEKAHEILRDYHRLFDIYNDYEGINNLKTVNEQAGIAPVKVDERLIALLEFGKEVYELTDGKVNIAEGAVLRLWHDKREAGILHPEHAELPDKAALTAASEHTDIDKLILNKEESTVYLEDAEMSLDVGGIAKGYAVERAGEALEELGAENYLLNIGGNLKAIGSRLDGTAWVCPVENPAYKDGESQESYAVTTGLRDHSLVTSGDYERFYTVDNVRYHHIIDPETKEPARFHRSVTILLQDSGMADALSTGLFLMNEEDGRRLLNKLNQGKPEEEQIQVMWIDGENQKSFTEGFSKYLQDNVKKSR